MTKQEIIKQITDATGIDRSDVSAVFHAAVSLIKTHMAKGRNVYIRGFGTFLVHHCKEKKARNISAGTTHIIPAHNAPKFRPSKMFKQMMAR